MSAGGARRGRRDNGLDATEYAVAADVDPRVGEHLLDVLAAGGIAAYLQPSSDLNPVTRTTTVPARPTDRLYVDRARLAAAREYIAKLGADGPPAAEPDVDAEWARIVAGFHAEIDVRTPPWPAAEDVRADAGAAGEAGTAEVGAAGEVGTAEVGTAGDAGAVASDDAGADPEIGGAAPRGSRLTDATHVTDISIGRRAPEPSLLDGLDTFGANLPDEPSEDEGYTPPPPPPLPRFSKYAVVGVLAIICGFVLFLFPTLLPIGRGVTTILGFGAILGGFVTLVLRLRSGDDEEEDDPENGAVV